MVAEHDDMTALRSLRSQIALEFASKVRDGQTPLADLRDLQERLRLLDAAIADPQRVARRRWRAAAIAALVVAVLLSMGALIPMPRVPFSLEAEAGAVRLQMPAAGELGPQQVDGELLVDGYTSLESPDAALMQQGGAPGSGRIAISAAVLNLRRVSYPAPSTIDMAAGAQAASLTIHSQRAPIGVEVEFSGRTTTRFGPQTERREADYPYAEWLRLRAGDASAAQRVSPPVVLSLARSANTEYRWSALQPEALRFVERGVAARNEAVVRSSLQKARIQLQASAAEVLLGAGEDLELSGLDVQRLDLRLGPVLQLKMSGTARGMLTRTGHFERSLKPSLLDYAARHKTVELLWSGAILLWGITRWLQRLAGSDA
jgi:hypothetical protein